MAEGIPGGSPASSLLGGRPQAPIMQLPMVAQLFQNSGLGRFGGNVSPYRPTPYIPGVYQPQPLPPRRQAHQPQPQLQQVVSGLLGGGPIGLGGYDPSSTGGA